MLFLQILFNYEQLLNEFRIFQQKLKTKVHHTTFTIYCHEQTDIIVALKTILQQRIDKLQLICLKAVHQQKCVLLQFYMQYPSSHNPLKNRDVQKFNITNHTVLLYNVQQEYIHIKIESIKYNQQNERCYNRCHLFPPQVQRETGKTLQLLSKLSHQQNTSTNTKIRQKICTNFNLKPYKTRKQPKKIYKFQNLWYSLRFCTNRHQSIQIFSYPRQEIYQKSLMLRRLSNQSLGLLYKLKVPFKNGHFKIQNLVQKI
eukprot:TRINITY_DN13472_c0_g1_i11.p2 TRINITY_DN13472_c0_g1~~TRINITY_DN13472_c0_g1_i11.p2  ORF type:complete len:257 (+),score=-11.67 TRINITY_DN13472_c0_g1_i11:379-1149(+)